MLFVVFPKETNQVCDLISQIYDKWVIPSIISLMVRIGGQAISCRLITQLILCLEAWNTKCHNSNSNYIVIMLLCLTGFKVSFALYLLLSLINLYISSLNLIHFMQYLTDES